KMIAFAWSGFIVAIAGALFSIVLGRITPDSFDLTQLLLHFAIVMIGGLGSLAGSLIGAVLLTAAPELLRNVAGVQEIAFAMLLILVLLLMPQGLSGLLTRYVPALRDRFFGEEP
ncbi:MAG: branched-chain amino acid ABC transporter permease, partial [Acetobacteraceae bacterium]